MAEFKDVYQRADWKMEKHVPVIETDDFVPKGELFKIRVSVGRQIPHPNSTEHHIRWIGIYFHANGEKFPYEIGRFEFNAHGESVTGINASTIYTHPEIEVMMKTDKSGIIFASSYCNIHGLWQNSKVIAVKMESVVLSNKR